MNEYVRFFFGNPRRTMFTFMAMFAVIIVAHPPLLSLIFARIVEAVGPILTPLFQLALIFFGIGWLFRSAFPKQKKGGKKD